MEVNKKTTSLNDLLLEIIKAAEKNRKRLFVTGGFALEIEVGRLTRNHDDLDLQPMEEDITWWKKWFKNKGFRVGYNDGIKDKTKAFMAHSHDSSFYADMYGVKVAKDGALSSAERGKRHNWGSTWQKVIKQKAWRGKKVYVIEYSTVLWLKKETVRKGQGKIRKKDIHDFKLFKKELV